MEKMSNMENEVMIQVDLKGKESHESISKSRQDKSKVNISEHLQPLDKVATQYGVSINESKLSDSRGLSSAEAAKRLAENGPNMLTPPKKRHWILRFLDLLLGLFNLLLIFCGIASYILLAIDFSQNKQQIYMGAIYIGVALMNASIEFFQQQKSAALLESFLNLIPSMCYVIRDGKQIQISAKDLVLGDLIYVRMGDKIPADLYIVGSTDFKVDNSPLTGEAEPQERSKRNTQENPLEATNLAFNGTLAVNGECYGIMIRGGDNTVIGQIASLTSSEERRESPLSVEIDSFVKVISSVAGVVAVIFFIISLQRQGFSAALQIAIGTFISFVPEGLPATVSMLLTIAAKRMATRQVLVKDLQGVETLGAITLLATDKTGTLTRNQMTVTYIWSATKLFYAQSGHPDIQGAKHMNLNEKGLNEILHIASLCCRATFDRLDVPVVERQVIGDATEAGLIRCAASRLEDWETLQDRYPKVFEIPFNSTNKWAMTIHKKRHENGTLMLYIKGAPERIIGLCNTFLNEGDEVVALSSKHVQLYEDMYRTLAAKGHRVLAFAALALPDSEFPEHFEFSKDPINYPTQGFTFYGLVSLEDPPKHGVREAVGHCRSAGIKVMMVTGDHPLTAEAIGRKINMMMHDTKPMIAKKRGVPESQVPESDVHAIVIHGDSIDSLTDVDWDTIFDKDEIIFARTSPKHKLDIVKRAQGRGHVVGVTGDGVNDSPALKKADLGIAMNISGSDVSKEAAAMILLDDNFASTVAGIEEGRLIFQNLKKSVRYTITHTMPEVWANLLNIAIPMPLPLSAILILVVDLGFELCIAISFAWDVSESRTGLMKLPPRKPVTRDSYARLKSMEEADLEDMIRIHGHRYVEEALSHDEKRRPSVWRRVFTRRFWREYFEKTDDDILVDSEVLSYSYLEAGTIQTLFCFAAFFYSIWLYGNLVPSDLIKNAADFAVVGNTNSSFVAANGQVIDNKSQFTILAIGQSAYYIVLMIQQLFNCFACKARLTYPWGRFMLSNKMTFIGAGVGALLCTLIIYLPFLNIPFQTDYRLDPLVCVVGVIGGIVLYLYNVARIAVRKSLTPIKYVDDIAGLQMFPTKMTMM